MAHQILKYAALLLVCLTAVAAQSDTVMNGWQSGDNSRSSFDILWSCFTAVFACTWTVLHVDVPAPQESDLKALGYKVLWFLTAVVCPEFVVWNACADWIAAMKLTRQFDYRLKGTKPPWVPVMVDLFMPWLRPTLESEEWQKKLRRQRLQEERLNKPYPEQWTRKNPDKKVDDGQQHEVKEPDEEQQVGMMDKSGTLENQMPDSDELRANLELTTVANFYSTVTGGPWTHTHSFILHMGGIVIQDDNGNQWQPKWTEFPEVISKEPLKFPPMKKTDLKGRTKVDGLAKLFAVFQSAWLLISVLARAADGLPVTPLEFSAIAYVGCCILTYLFWWYKPQDFASPFVIRHFTALSSHSSKQGQTRAEKSSSEIDADTGSPGSFAVPIKRRNYLSVQRYSRYLGLVEFDLSRQIGVFSGLAFCAVHVAAWNFEFPTTTEKTLYRVLALLPIGAIAIPVVLLGLHTILTMILRFGTVLSGPNKSPSSKAEITKLEWFLHDFLVYGSLAFYLSSRIMLIVITVMSLRNLPEGCFQTVDWLDFVPHL